MGCWVSTFGGFVVERLESRYLLATAAMDSGFGEDGRTVVPFDDISNLVVSGAVAVSVAPDGHTFLAGSANEAKGNPIRAVVACLNSNGEVETGFGNAGRVTYGGESSTDFPRFFSVVALSDGGVLAGGSTHFLADSSRLVIARYQADGDLDPTFGGRGNGRFLLDMPYSVDTVRSLQLLPDGKILALVEFGGARVLRLLPDGRLDETFGTGGMTAPVAGGPGRGRAMAVQPDGRIVIGGSAWANSIWRPRLARFTPAGLLDTTFGVAGTCDATGWLGNGDLSCVIVRPEGIVVAGSTPSASTQNLYIAQISVDAKHLDLQFGGGGIRIIGQSTQSEAALLCELPDRSFLCAYTTSVSFSRTIVRQYTPNGVPDYAFGLVGQYSIPSACVSAMTLQPDGKAVLAGNLSDMQVLRLSDSFPQGSVVRSSDRVLHVTGTSGSDVAEMERTADGQIQIFMNGISLISIPESDLYYVDLDLIGGDDQVMVKCGDRMTITYDGGDGQDGFALLGSLGDDDVNIQDISISAFDTYVYIGAVEDLSFDDPSGDDKVYCAVADNFGRSLRLNAGAGCDEITLGLTPKQINAVTIEGGEGDDTIIWRAHSGSASIDGGGGYDELQITGGGLTEAVNVFPDQLIFGTAHGGPIADIERLNFDLQGGPDTISFYGTSPQWEIAVATGAGNDTFVFSDDLGSTVFPKPIVIDPGEGDDWLRIIGSAEPMTVHVSAAELRWAQQNLSVTFSNLICQVSIVGGNGDDEFEITPGPLTTYYVEGGDSETHTGDTMAIVQQGAAVAHIHGNQIVVEHRIVAYFSGIETIILDPSPPLVEYVWFSCEARQQIGLRFSEDVFLSVDLNDLYVLDLTTNRIFEPPLLNTTGGVGVKTEAVWQFYSPRLLPDGLFRAVLPRGSVLDVAGNAIDLDFTFDFFILAGDANRDRRVDLQDLMILANNWMGTGKTFSQGDFNYDGVVNAADLGILATRWQGTLSPLVAAEAVPTAAKRTPVRTPTRISSQILT